jgi:hypothetical protein
VTWAAEEGDQGALQWLLGDSAKVLFTSLNDRLEVLGVQPEVVRQLHTDRWPSLWQTLVKTALVKVGGMAGAL